MNISFYRLGSKSLKSTKKNSLHSFKSESATNCFGLKQQLTDPNIVRQIFNKGKDMFNRGQKEGMYFLKDEKTNVVYSYTVFENQPNEMMVLCVWRKGLFEFEGWQGY